MTDAQHLGPLQAPERDAEALIERLNLRIEERRIDDVTVPEGWMEDAKGRLVREPMVPATKRLEDDTVRRILAYGLDLADQIARFRAHSFDDLSTFQDLLAEKYQAPKRGGVKGNVTFTTFDGRGKVVIQSQDQMAFGPELQHARDLVMQCLADWSSDARDEIRTIVQHAFQVDKEGRVNREAIFQLRRLSIDDDRWRRAQAAISDSINIVGSKVYMRLYWRPTPEDRWQPIPIDIAADWQPGKEL